MDNLEFDTFSKISDLSDFPYFKEAYHYPIQADGVTTSADEILILTDFNWTYDLITPGNDEDEDDEYEILNIAEFSSYMDDTVGRPERGYFAFKFAENDIAVDSAGAVGFIRKSRRINDLPSVKMDGYFVGATALVEWDFLSYLRELQIDLEYEIDGVSYARSDLTSYSVLSDGLVFGGISIPVTDEVDSLMWSFSSMNLTHLEYGDFYGVVGRSDVLDADDLEGIIPDSSDPDTLWNRNYVIRFSSPRDRDRDHIPDMMDQTLNVTPFPWYADVETYNYWYWSHWLGLWIYSDRLSDWDYWQYFGWVFVTDSGTREDFWVYSPGISPGWLVSSESSYPTVYDTLNQEYLYLAVVNEEMGYVYSYKTDTWSPVTP